MKEDDQRLIPVVVRRRVEVKPQFNSRNCTNSIKTKQCQTYKPTVNSELFAVPKCMFLNICTLMKTKEGVRALVPLEAYVNAIDVDICVIWETHLNRDIPN